jgi:hypothetical protein
MPEKDPTVSLAFLRRRLAEQETRRGTLPPGDGGGTSDRMEARVGRLEEDMKEVKGDLKTLLRDTAEMKGRLNAMPTTIQLIAFVVAIFAAAGLLKYFGH